MSCTPQFEICRKRGDTKTMTFRLKVNGVVQDITDDTFLLTVNRDKEPADTTNQLFQLAGTIVSASGGLFSFQPADDQPVDPGSYFYDIQWLEDVANEKLTILAGKYVVEQDITKT